MADLKKLAEEIVGLTLLEAQELKTILKDEYGIEPAAGGAVMMAGPAGGAGDSEGSSDEKTEFDVILKSAGDKKINVSDIEKFFSVLICSPRTLLVAVKTPVFTVHVLVIHAPWSAKPSSLTDAIRKKIDDFWDDLFSELRKFPSISSYPLLVFADMNDRLGPVENRVGAIRMMLLIIKAIEYVSY